MSKALSPEVLLGAGYRQYPASANDSPYCHALFQRRVRDDVDGSTRYFINIKNWDFPGAPSMHWSVDVQFHLPENGSVDVQLHIHEHTLEEVEAFYSKIYTALGCVSRGE